MKRYFLTLAAVAVTAMASAQFKYGPKLGVNTSNFENDIMVFGFHGGGFLTTELADRLGVQAEFLYSFKGNKHVSGTGNSEVTTTSRYRFVEVPIMFYFPISDHLRGFIGPQLNFYRKGEQTVKGKSGPAVVSPVTGTGVMSWCTGFDIVLDSPITIGARFVSNRFNSGVGGSGATEEFRLRSLLVSVGYRLDW